MAQPLMASVGWSERGEAWLAGKEAAQIALKQLSPAAAKLAFVFGSSWFDQALLMEGVRSVFGAVPLAGESTSGEIVPTGPLNGSCVVLALGGEAIICSVGVGERADEAPRLAGQEAAMAAIRGFRAKTRLGCVVFGEGMMATPSEAIRGLQEVLGTGSVLVGGMAGHDLGAACAVQYGADRVIHHGIVGVLLGGAMKISVGMAHGFFPISKPRRITKARANVLYELDRQPAASIYEEYFGAEVIHRLRREGIARQGLAYPLGVQPTAANAWLLRHIVSFGDDGSVACSAEIAEQAWSQLMIGNKALLLDAAAAAAREALQPLNRVACALVFDSASRRRLLGAAYAAKEIACLRDVMGPDVPFAGCYTSSEHAPWEAGGVSERHALQTGSILVVALGT